MKNTIFTQLSAISIATAICISLLVSANPGAEFPADCSSYAASTLAMDDAPDDFDFEE